MPCPCPFSTFRGITLPWDFGKVLIPISIKVGIDYSYSKNPLFSYTLQKGLADNLELYPGSGAWHGSERAIIFETAKSNITGIANTQKEEQLSQLFMQAVGAFVRDPKEGLTKELEWPRYGGSGTKSLIAIAKAESCRWIQHAFGRCDLFNICNFLPQHHGIAHLQ
ncbi:hypothetical protein DER46DRAFT_568735 [Fusarium sp. MPI-SDFR-AT-0072]|nr:hypothetical protein DER46DRAFT_568735 [Fusarium sp. MPI-SDFR-AT-0072]